MKLTNKQKKEVDRILWVWCMKNGIFPEFLKNKIV